MREADFLYQTSSYVIWPAAARALLANLPHQRASRRFHLENGAPPAASPAPLLAPCAPSSPRIAPLGLAATQPPHHPCALQTLDRKIRSFVARPKLACQKPEFDACSGNGDIEHTNVYK